MKRFFAILLCSIIIICNFVPIFKGKAAEVIIEQGIDFLYKGWDMINSIINGGVIQTSPYQGIADQTTALAAFYDDWGENLLKVTNYIVPSDDAVINSQSAITFPLKLGMTRNYYNDFVNTYINFALNSDNGFKVELSPDSIAAWNRYNYYWIQKYLNAFNEDIPTAYPDPLYSAYINRINERNINDNTAFWFYDVLYQSGNYILLTHPTRNYSWINNSTYPSTVGEFNSGYVFPSDIISINIFSNENGYFYSVSGQGINKVCSINGLYSNNTSFRKYNDNINPFGYSGALLANPTSLSYSFSLQGTLNDVLNDISKHFKNVNIYVDGVLWSYVGGTEPTFTAPDVIMNQDGIILGHDVYLPEQDLYIDLISWRNLLEEKLADGATIDFDDLIDGGVIVDSNDIPVTDENKETLFKKREASTVIDIGLENADTSDFLPDAPAPPDDNPTDWNFPEFPIPDFPDGGDPKSTGLSVLARIINVTNQSLPPALISMFWGICITLVILGIIKILHK